MDLNEAVRKLFRGSAVIFVGTVLELLISFVGKLLIARYLGPTDYGAVSIGVAFLSFSSSVLILGIDTGLTRYLPRFTDEGKKRRLIAVGLLLGLTLPSVVGFGVTVGAEFVATELLHAPESVIILQIFAVTLPFAAFVYLALAITRGMQLPVPQTVIQNFTLPLVRLSGIALALYLGSRTFGFSLAYAAPFFIATIIAAYYLYQSPLFSNAWSSEPVAYNLLAFSIPLSISAIAGKVLSDVDTFILSYYQATNVVGTYGVIYPIAGLISAGNMAAGFMFLPILSEQHAKGEEENMRKLYQVTTKWVILGTLPLALSFILYPQVIISITFGSEYLGGAAALSVLTVGFFVDAALGVNSEMLASIGHTRWVAFCNVAAAVLNVVLNVALVPEFSLLGAAWATTLALILMNTLLSWKLYEETGVHIFSRALIRVGAVSLTTAGGLFLAFRHFFAWSFGTVAVALLVFFVVYTVSILRFGGIEEEEVMIVNSIEERFGLDFEPVKRIFRYFMRE